MIARPVLSSDELPLPVYAPVSGRRASRIAVIGRRKVGVRSRYRALTGVCAWITAVTAVVMVYLALLANVSHLHYELARADAQRAELQDATMRLDDKIAHLESRERLAAVA